MNNNNNQNYDYTNGYPNYNGQYPNYTGQYNTGGGNNNNDNNNKKPSKFKTLLKHFIYSIIGSLVMFAIFVIVISILQATGVVQGELFNFGALLESMTS